jgi:membrane protein DedA with SNARE-associated domain
MPFRRFLLAALSGSIVWCIGILSIGWVLGPRCLLALHLVQSYTIPAIGGLILLIAITVLIQYRVNRFIRSRFSSAAVSQEVEEQPDNCDLIEI